jgi:hypothetical protein
MNELPEPTEHEIFLASEGFGPPAEAISRFSGFDALAPGGPVPTFDHVDPVEQADMSVTCGAVQRNLQLHLDGELVPAQHLLIANHLSSCLACQSAQLFQTQLRTVVAQKALDPVPDELRTRIARALGIE